MDELVLDEEKFKSIARLPTREVLDGQLAGVVASPLTGLVRGLGSMVSGLANQLQQLQEKKEKEEKMATKVKTKDWIEELKGISVLELSDRIKANQEKF